MSKNTSDQNISSDLTTGLPVFRDAAGKQVDFNTNPKPASYSVRCHPSDNRFI